jgi:hypothetical protein
MLAVILISLELVSHLAMQPKLIYLARRRPDMNREDFVTRWRQHGALGMSRPRWKNIARYVHCDVLNAGADIPGISDDYDGVGMIWHKSPQARATHRADVSSQTDMESDEEKTFREPVANFCLLAAETQRSMPGSIDGSTVKLIRFLKYADPSQCDRLSQRISEQNREMFARTNDARGWPIGYCINTTLEPQSEGLSAWGLKADCTEELWFRDLDELVSYRERCDADPTPLNLPDRLIASRIEVITKEVVLHDATDQPSACDRQ